MKKPTVENIKDTSIKSTKRLLGESMFVKKIRDKLHTDVLKPRKSKFRFEMSDKAAAFHSSILQRNKFDIDILIDKDTVISPGYEFRYSKKLERLIGKHENWLKLR